MLKVSTLQRSDYSKYDAFLEKLEGSLFYYTSQYKDFLENLLHVKSIYQVVSDDSDNFQAVLPLMIRQGKYGPVLNSLPFYGSNGGVLSLSHDAYNLLREHYLHLRTGYASSVYISNPLIFNDEIPHEHKQRRLSQWTKLNSKDEIWSSYSTSAKRNVKKAIQSKVQVEVSNEDFEFLCKAHQKNMSEIGGLAKDESFFKSVPEFFKENIDFKIYIAKVDGSKVAGLLVFFYKDTVEYFTPVTLSQYRSIQPMALIIYQAMLDAHESGFKKWNWGGTWLSQDGVYRFKKNFGAHDLEYFYYVKIESENLYKSNKQEILDEYPNFYVLPFDKLRG